MSMCSYATLSRYEDDFACRSKLDGIREKLRESIERIRYKARVVQMLDNRPSLSKFYDDDDDYEYQPDDWNDGPVDELGWPISSGSSQADDNVQQEYDCELQVQTYDWSSEDTDSHCQPSPCWSAASSSTPSVVQLGSHNVPYYFLESNSTSPRSSRSTGRSNRSSSGSNIRQRRYKQNSLSLPVNRNRYFYDVSLAKNDLQTIKDIILQCNLDPTNISQAISTRCPLLLNAMQTVDDDLCRESLGILTSLAQKSLILPDAILILFQNGFINCLRDCMYRLQDGILQSLTLLVNIANSTPSTVPYIVELLRNSSMFTDLENSIHEVDIEKSIFFVKFIHQIIQSLLTEPQPTPSIPVVLLATGISKETLDSYSPLSTCIKLTSPAIIQHTVDTCLDKYYIDNEEVITSALLMLASIIKLVHTKSDNQSGSTKDTEWIINMLKSFKNSDLDNNLNKLVKALDRIVQQAEFSEHCSQGVGVGSSAATLRDQCQQFSSFYQQYYGSLVATYGHMM